MAAETSFLVEEFIDAITSQLDRVQDALRIKAVNRPLTYALKDLALELRVFVELDPQGRVRFRTSAPGESGASVVNLGFTTITKPMIEENTVSLASTRSPTLEEAGLEGGERRRLERYGIRNLAELQNLGKSAGIAAISRFSDVPADRLRNALSSGKPAVTAPPMVMPVKPLPPPPKPVVAPPKPLPQPVVAQPVVAQPVPPHPTIPTFTPKPLPPKQQLQIAGKNFLGADKLPIVKLNKKQLDIAEAEDDRLIVDVPDEALSGSLEIELPDGSVMAWDLAADAPAPDEWASWEDA